MLADSALVDGLLRRGDLLGEFGHAALRRSRDGQRFAGGRPRATCYSLAATIHFMLTGAPPFPDGARRVRADRHGTTTIPHLDSTGSTSRPSWRTSSSPRLSGPRRPRRDGKAELAAEPGKTPRATGFAAEPLPRPAHRTVEPQAPPRRSGGRSAAPRWSVLGSRRRGGRTLTITAVSDGPRRPRSRHHRVARRQRQRHRRPLRRDNVDPLLADRSPTLTRILDDVQGAPAVGSVPGTTTSCPRWRARPPPRPSTTRTSAPWCRTTVPTGPCSAST